ncbi:yfhO [Wigglesworthia glossinidia endosymbiont of Glossina brevipalpis]|uniref:cysteine desulfurase n=1 Tax=Wigglesworthia glossinidia brevipalpis TaxID=36870 RepID=Q8D2S0_WIGBR|nr:yfhO [Wigglesworthia glossinidia endosymbiont of Glossina brevipalpis]
MKFPIYLDYASTTPVDQRVYEEMIKYLKYDGIFGNPSSRSHIYGWKAEQAVEKSRKNISNLINSDAREIIFTSGATESNNLAIKGSINFNKTEKLHVISGETEHISVLDTLYNLQENGIELTLLSPNKNGIIHPKRLEEKIKKNTVLVSLMHVNNETGIIQDIESFCKICKSRKILFHVDATQSIGKIPIDVSLIPIDLMSFSSHKIYGPKGVGALFLRRKPPIYFKAQIHGGGQEKNFRSGTLPVHQIVGMGKACAILKDEMNLENKKIKLLRDKFLSGIKEKNNILLNGDPINNIPNILNITFLGIDSKTLIILLKDLAISSGSACSSEKENSSHVLKAMGLNHFLSKSSIRFSIGRFTSKEDISFAINQINNTIKILKENSKY